jgi:hypothetical protein
MGEEGGAGNEWVLLEVGGFDRAVLLFGVVWAKFLLEARSDHDLGV